MRELLQSLCVAIYLPLRLGIGSIDRTNPDGVPSEPSRARPARVARTPHDWRERSMQCHTRSSSTSLTTDPQPAAARRQVAPVAGACGAP